MRKNFFVILFLFFLSLANGFSAFSAVTPSEKWTVALEQSIGSVEFRAIGWPSALKIHGVGIAPKGLLTVLDLKLTGTASFTLDSLDTGIKMRNEHMKKKYLETEKYPQAQFTFTKMILPDTLKQENINIEKLPFEGTLSLHGVDKIISGLANIERKINQVQVTASFGFKISDFSIPKPGFAGITMADDVTVQVEFKGPILKSK